MMLAALLIGGGAVTLLLVLWTLKVRAKRLLHRPKGSHLHKIDVIAFRNLLSRSDEEFLRNSLPPFQYGQVRRQRIRAAQEYLLWIAGNCASLMEMLRSSVDVPEAESSVATPRLVRTALKLRVICLASWTLLWIEYALPYFQVRPLAILRRYEELSRTAEMSIRTRVPRLDITSGQGTRTL